MKLARWFVATMCGWCAWQVAAAGNTMNFWPRMGMWLLFWILLAAYAYADKTNE